MSKTKSLKRALFTAILSVIVCLSMFVGTTFAWFTDSVTSANNKIVAGRLSVDLQMKTENGWVSIKDSNKAIFDYENWEPGYSEVKMLKVENNGTLALKWKAMFVSQEKLGILADVIDVYVLPTDNEPVMPDRDFTGYSYVGTISDFVNTIEETTNGELKAKESKYLTIGLKMKEEAGNDYQNQKIGKFDIQIVATQLAYENDSFGSDYDDGSTYFDYEVVTSNNISTIDFTQENQTFNFSGPFEDITISNLGEGSVIEFSNASVGAFNAKSDITIKGTVTMESFNVTRDSTEPVIVDMEDANLNIVGGISIGNTEGKSVLNISNSNIVGSSLFVGAHVNNNRAGLAEFNVEDSYLSFTESGCGSTINIWGRSGVKSSIINSEIYTYSRGWHQSEDANDNSITFQGATNIDVEIKNSNFHLYGARSIINARQYGSEDTNINFTIEDSLIWVVTKSSHAETTLPVWNATSITDTILLFTKNVYNETTEPVVSHWVYGNPVISGVYNITTQCNWKTNIDVRNQTITFASDAEVSVYEEAKENVNFVIYEGGEIVVEDGASINNINFVAANGFELVETKENGKTIYSIK